MKCLWYYDGCLPRCTDCGPWSWRWSFVRAWLAGLVYRAGLHRLANSVNGRPSAYTPSEEAAFQAGVEWADLCSKANATPEKKTT